MSRRCQCIKHSDGKQCSYNSKPDSNFCGVHKNCTTKLAVTSPVKSPAKLPVECPMKDKIRNKFRTQTFNKNPKLKPLYEKILQSYGIKLSAKCLGSGSYADIFDLGNGKVLRLEPSNYFLKIAKNRQHVIEFLMEHPTPDLFPTIYNYKIHTFGESSGWILEMVMEKLNIVPWSEWKNYFSSSRKLIDYIKDQTRRMIQMNLLHNDISSGNVVLTAEGKILFVDLDEICISPNCYDVPGITLGYYAPEWALDKNFSGYYKKSDKDPLLQMIKSFGVDPLKITTVHKKESYGKVSYHEEIAKNMIFGIGALIYHILTGKNPAEGISIGLLPSDVELMVHPDPNIRTM